MPLIILPSTPATENASTYLTQQEVAHQVIMVPESLGYKTGSDLAIYLSTEVYASHGDIAMLLTRQRFVVMRVFKDFSLS